MADIPHATRTADSVAIGSTVTNYFLQVKAASGVKVRGRFLLHCLGTASTDIKATVWVARGYSDSAGSGSTVVICENEDSALTAPITGKLSTTTEPSGTAVVAHKVKVFTQGQWLLDECTIRNGETLTLVVKNEAAGSLNFYAEWTGV